MQYHSSSQSSNGSQHNYSEASSVGSLSLATFGTSKRSTSMPIPTKKTKNNLEGERWETVMTTLRSMNQLQKASEQLLRQLVDTKQHEQVQQQQQEEEEQQKQEDSTCNLTTKVNSMEKHVQSLELKLVEQEQKLLAAEQIMRSVKQIKENASKRKAEAKLLFATAGKRRRRRH
jgi:hypothetical protein